MTIDFADLMKDLPLVGPTPHLVSCGCEARVEVQGIGFVVRLGGRSCREHRAYWEGGARRSGPRIRGWTAEGLPVLAAEYT